MTFIASRLRAGMTPITRSRLMATGASGKKGSPLIVDADGKYATADTDPAQIAAFAESDYGSDTSGFAHLGVHEFPPGELLGASTNNNQPFIAKYMGTAPTVDGGDYGITLDTDGFWKVDFDKTVNVCVHLQRLLNATVDGRTQCEITVIPTVVQSNI